ncbi:MAG: ribonuclease P protein component [Ideonella sp.]|nr:ribonuclease P protein component [Ideonella sp.]MCC7457575.1 ribonuclease P protein component [Nitrospira sp.]
MMLGRLLRSADFEAVLATAPRARSAHFAAHHLPRPPGGPKRHCKGVAPTILSTGDAWGCPQTVDDITAPRAPDRCWLGCVIPKRHARRAVARNLLRRQIRAAARRCEAQLAHGLWLVRLRAPFDAHHFRSAGSRALASAARAELDGLLARVTA